MDTPALLWSTWQALGLDAAHLPGTFTAAPGPAHPPIGEGEPPLAVVSPIDGQCMAVLSATPSDRVSTVLQQAQSAFEWWRDVPAPQRGELVRLLGLTLREHKAQLGTLVSLEAGKITAEGLGEVQEMIDICDFAVGLSRQLHGLSIASERPEHRMMEQWHPLGVVGVMTAFNFPVAVWSWNAALALVCGNAVVWKPSEKTPLTALAVQALLERAARHWPHGDIPPGLSQVVVGDSQAGQQLAADRRVALVSATGSTRMGRAVAPVVAQRLGRCLLELGGNNAVVVAPSADLNLATRAIVFGAVGTAGQRCTTTRRLIVHESVHAALVQRLLSAYQSLTIGNPLQDGVLMGPLIDAQARERMQAALAQAQAQGGRCLYGGHTVNVPGAAQGYYVQPALVDMPQQTAVVQEETFAPILYILRYRTWEEAIALNNGVPQGLSSAIFTRDLTEAEAFMAASGSDCGIANVNLGTSGAEIGGAFGGEKETGGGRESGSDAWRQYMRRSTNTINRGSALPLAQGVRFDL